MGITTIQVTDETKKKIASFGTKEDSYDTILQRIYKLAVKTQLKDFLMSSENTIPIEEAIKEAKGKWPESE